MKLTTIKVIREELSKIGITLQNPSQVAGIISWFFDYDSELKSTTKDRLELFAMNNNIEATINDMDNHVLKQKIDDQTLYLVFNFNLNQCHIYMKWV